MSLSGKVLIVLLVLLVAGVTAGVFVASQRPEPQPSPTPTFVEVSPSPADLGDDRSAVCTNEAVGYSIEFPDDWFTQPVGGQACRAFHPEPFEVPENSELTTAVLIVPDEATFEETVASAFDEMFATTVVREETTIDGRPAIRFETESTGEGLYEAGTRFHGYLIDHDGFGFLIQAVGSPGDPAFEEYRRVVDEAVTTLTFL